MRIKATAQNIHLVVENSAGESVLDVAYDNYYFDLNLEKGANAISALVQKFGEVAAQIEAASKITH